MLLATVLLATLVACGGGTSSSAPAAPSSAPPPASSSVPEPEPEPLNQAFLTGLAKDADYPEGKRITAVMLNNVPGARPQNGIGDAQILVEIKVEYGVTRFMALFEDYEKIPRTGGLRSARDQFFQLLLPYQGFYVHEGPSHPSHPVNQLLSQYDYKDLDVQALYYNTRTVDPNRGVPNQYSWYDVSAETISEHIAARELDDYRNYGSPIFCFVPYNEEPRVPGDGSASAVEVAHVPPYYISYFDYDEATHRYGMSMHNSNSGQKQQTVDNNTGEQVAFDNVLVLFAPFSTWPGTAPENLPKVDYGQGGAGYYFSQGGYEMIFWQKGAADAPLQLYKGDKSGEKVLINPGTTYLAVVDDTLLEAFYDDLTGGKMGKGSGAVTSEAPVAD